MSITMDKELLIRVPLSLYKRTKALCRQEYISISALVRELLLEKVGESLTDEEMGAINKADRLFHKGKGVNWRKVRRG